METSGKLKRLANEHRKFLGRRNRAGGEGAEYPTTRTTREINEGRAAPTIQGGMVGFLGMGARPKSR